MIADTQINTTIQGNQSQPSVTTLTDGGFVVCWVSDMQDGSGYGVYAQQFNANGVTQGNEFRVNTYTIDYQGNPAITALNDGGFVVSWASYNQDGSGYYEIYAQRFNANGEAQGSEFRVNTYTLLSHVSLVPVITALNDGGFVVGWAAYSQVGLGAGMYVQRFDVTGVKQGSQFRVNTFDVSLFSHPAITTLNNGDVVVNWLSADDSGYGIYAQRFNANGEAQGSNFRVNTQTVGQQLSPAVTALNEGGFVVIWQSSDDNIFGIYAQRYDANGVVQGSEFLVNTYTIGYQTAPAVTALNEADFVVSWTSEDDQDGSGNGVYAQRFDENGVAQGSEFRVNTYTIDSQRYPAITSLKDGGFVVSWESSGQDGDSSGIFAHRYNAAGYEVGWIAADRLFNWAEDFFSDLFPNHPESIEIYGFHARIYENGKALGEQNDNIYFYDGHSVILVGTVNDYLPDAIAAGF